MKMAVRTARIAVLSFLSASSVGCLVLNPDFDRLITGSADPDETGGSGISDMDPSRGSTGDAPTGSDPRGDDSTTGGDPTDGDPNTPTTASTTGDPCPACDAAEAACQASVPCQTIDALAKQCPPADLLTCVNDLGCTVLVPSAVAEGTDLWSDWIGCVSHECLDLSDPCADLRTGCLGDGECAAINACISATCTCVADDAALACWNACAEQHPAGRDAWETWLACVWR